MGNCGLGTTTAPIPWNLAFGTSGCVSNQSLLISRSVFALVCLAHWVWHLSIHLPTLGVEYFYFLTHWSFIAETVYLVLLVPLTFMAQSVPVQPAMSQFELLKEQEAQESQPKDPSRMMFCCSAGPFGSQRRGVEVAPSGSAAVSPTQMSMAISETQPAFAKFMMALFMIVQPLSLLVVLLYWTLDLPVWELCAISPGPTCRALPDYLGFFVHGIDFVLMLVSFFIGRIPYYFSNSLWFELMAIAYGIWTYIHFALRLGKSQGCSLYPFQPEECPIYDAIDWHNSQAALTLLAAILLVAVPIHIVVYWGLAKLRGCCSKPVQQ